MASGVAAVVRNLPAGSPSIFYCIHSIVEKANSMCSGVNTDGTNLMKSKEGGWEPIKKLLELLVRLLSLVDVQVSWFDPCMSPFVVPVWDSMSVA